MYRLGRGNGCRPPPPPPARHRSYITSALVGTGGGGATPTYTHTRRYQSVWGARREREEKRERERETAAKLGSLPVINFTLSVWGEGGIRVCVLCVVCCMFVLKLFSLPYVLEEDPTTTTTKIATYHTHPIEQETRRCIEREEEGDKISPSPSPSPSPSFGFVSIHRRYPFQREYPLVDGLID